MSRFTHPLAVIVATLGLLIATLNVNVSANVVSPANDFSNLAPRYVSFKLGGVITCLIGLAMMPWKLIENYGNYIFGWLVGYSGFLGPIAGVLISDYFLVRRRVLAVERLYRRNSEYEYSRGVNWRAVAALLAGAGVAFVGLLYQPLRLLYDYAWFVGFAVAAMTYLALTLPHAPGPVTEGDV
jgi:NCS1 family nucleobase:cation symporter-1